jgi:hypothetical protein
MLRVYRFEVIDERYRSHSNAVLRARDSADDSIVTLCAWRLLNPNVAVDSEKLAGVVATLGGAEFFSTASTFYLASLDDAHAAAALETLRAYGWFSGEWPGLIAAPVETKPAQSAAPPPNRNRKRIAPIAAAVCAVGIVAALLLWINVNPRPPAANPGFTTAEPVVSSPQAETLPVSQPPASQAKAEEPSDFAQPKTDTPPAPPDTLPTMPASQPVPEAIMQVLSYWRAAMLATDADGSAECYAPVVELFFRRKNLDRETLRRMSASGMRTWPHVDRYELSDYAFEPIGVDRAAVTFRKLWDSWDGPRVKEFAGEEKQRLTFEKLADDWKIVREEELHVDWVKKQ